MLNSKVTQSCQNYGHPEFEIEYNSEYVVDVDIEWFLSFLADQVANGVKYQSGHLIQIGWMMNRIETIRDRLTLLEPDFKDFPIHFVREVTNTLRHLRLQKSVVESVGLENILAFPNIRQSGIICSRHQDSIDFVMDRSKSENQDSGWFVGCEDPNHNHNDPANLQRTSLYELVLAKPDCIPFLALPEHSFVRKISNKVEIKYKQEALKIKANSYLEKYMERY